MLVHLLTGYIQAKFGLYIGIYSAGSCFIMGGLMFIPLIASEGVRKYCCSGEQSERLPQITIEPYHLRREQYIQLLQQEDHHKTTSYEDSDY